MTEVENKPILWAVFADYSDYPAGGMGGCVCLTADWRAACYVYRALVGSVTDKNLSMWQLEENKWEKIDMEKILYCDEGERERYDAKP